MTKNAFLTMIEGLKTAGYRITPQRKAICRALAESKEHPSAQMIYEQLQPEYETLSLATVYNTLDALSQSGAIQVLGEVGDNSSARYDADTNPHVNLVCVNCHRIVDMESEYVNRLDQEIEDRSGYSLLSARVLYQGVCPECQLTRKASQAGSAS